MKIFKFSIYLFLFFSIIPLAKALDRSFYQLGINAQKKGDLIAAIGFFQKCLKKNPMALNCHLNMATLYAKANDKKNAQIVFKDLLELYPFNLAVNFNKALFSFKQRQYQSAVFYFTRAKNLRPSFVPIYFYLSHIFERQGNLQNARIQIDKIMELAPKDKTLALYSAQFYQRYEEFLKSEKIYLNLLYKNQKDLQVLAPYTDFLCKNRDRIHDCLINLNEMISLRPNDLELKLQLASTYQAIGNIDQAKKEYHSTLEDFPKSSRSYEGLGILAQKEKSLDKAIYFFNKALSLNKKLIFSRIGKAEIYKKRNFWDKAAKEYEILKSFHPNRPEIKKFYKNLYERLNHDKENKL